MGISKMWPVRARSEVMLMIFCDSSRLGQDSVTTIRKGENLELGINIPEVVSVMWWELT